MNSDTPRTDNVAGDGTTVPADFAADLEREVTAAKAEVERLRANRDFWHQACLQAQEHRDGANASNAVWEAETVKLRAEVERLREALTGLVDFVDGPAEAKRPDVFALRMNAARTVLKEPK